MVLTKPVATIAFVAPSGFNPSGYPCRPTAKRCLKVTALRWTEPEGGRNHEDDAKRDEQMKPRRRCWLAEQIVGTGRQGKRDISE